MTVGVNVTTPDLPKLLSKLKDFRNDQVPFALSMAMNRAAKDAVTRMRRELDQVFELRRGSLRQTFGPSGRMGDTSRGWSSKSQWPRMSVDLHSLAPSMSLQEAGGTKPFAARNVWIPTRHVPRLATGGKPKRFQPASIKRRLKNKQRGPTRVFERGGVVYQRTRATGATVPLYLVRRTARIDPALGFEGVVRDTFNAKLYPRFAQAMAKAMRTAR